MTWRERVLRELDDERDAMVKLLATLVRVPSMGGSIAETGIQATLAGWMRETGFDVDHWRLDIPTLMDDPRFPGAEVERNDAWGLVGRSRGVATGPRLMFNGHVDVVPPGDPDAWQVTAPFAPLIRDGRMYGRGTCDMKAGLVAALFAVKALRRAQVPLCGELLVAAVTGEEDGGLGTFGLLERGWSAEACVIPEPTSLDIVPANAGALTFRLRVSGLATHASQRTKGVSAVEHFWPVFQALRQLEAVRNRQPDPLMDRWDMPYPIEIGTVRAGDWVSSVPDLLIAEGRVGVALDESVSAARDELEAAVERACREDTWLRDHPVEVEWWGGQFAAGRLPESESAIADRVAATHREVTGKTPGTWGAPYGSDLRLLTGLGGIPTVQYGPGDVAHAHAPNEFVPLDELHTAARTLALTALDYCGVADQ